MEFITDRLLENNPQPPADPIPDGFDPAATPIIARHFFGWQHLGVVAERAVLCIPPPEREP